MSSENLLSFRARHGQLSHSGGIELRQDLNADSSGLFLKQANHEFNRLFVLPAGALVMSVDENIRVHELNAHATRLESTRSRREFLCRERSEFCREIAGRPLNYLSLLIDHSANCFSHQFCHGLVTRGGINPKSAHKRLG